SDCLCFLLCLIVFFVQVTFGPLILRAVALVLAFCCGARFVGKNWFGGVDGLDLIGLYAAHRRRGAAGELFSSLWFRVSRRRS
ncbi:hypothetical protein, partial [Fulvimarina pelagi]|uniref:hypothetical protein n=1 Tax=Fulvimarina pelagi TaxID=217511 RepID=UPI001AEBD96A